MINKMNLKKYNLQNRQAKSKGFTLIELALVILVIGVIVSAAQSFYRDSIKTSEYAKINSHLEGINQAIITFAMENKRLPCADTDGNGYESSGSPPVCRAGVLDQTGAVPYKTLGMNQMADTQTQLVLSNIIYGVYRNANSTLISDADLAQNIDRTGDLPGSQYYQNNFDLIKGLTNAETAIKSNSYIYTTGIGTNENCSTFNQTNLAYVLVSAGIEDQDNDGNVFDGVNKNLKLNGTGTNCFASSSQRKNNQYDDVVLVMNFQSLIGRLNKIN
jgi:prepilin-type N-terminal cleavage/methylation domain-containing protein